MYKTIALCGLIAAFSVPALAGDVEIQSDKSVTWQAGVDGVALEFNADGSFKRLYSRADHPVNFPDRAGISKAQTIAEEEAKAHIVSFIKQFVVTGQTTTQVDNDMSKSNRDVTDGKEIISKNITRTIVENVTKFSGSFSNGVISGVIVLERGYDDKKESAYATMGVSAKSISAARGLSDMLNGDPAAADTSAPKAPPVDNGVFKRQDSEARKSNTDW
jgi:hypothetical protein